MKRAITEWGLVFSLVLLAAIGFLWVGSQFAAYFREPLLVAPDLCVRIDDGRLFLFSELGTDWKPADEGLEPKAISWVRRYYNWQLPGMEYHNRLFANGRTIWSLEVSLVIVVSVLLTVIATLWRVRLGGWLPRKPLNEH